MKMLDLMDGEQYRKACRYRMQEALENLAGLWQTPEEDIDHCLIDASLQWLERIKEELDYFKEKVIQSNH